MYVVMFTIIYEFIFKYMEKDLCQWSQKAETIYNPDIITVIEIYWTCY